LKANPKMKADQKADAAAQNPKKKLLAVAAGAAVLVALGGAGAWHFLGDGAATAGKKEKAAARAEQPEYVALEQFTVNLQPGEAGDQYLQVQLTLQVPNLEQAETFKNNMAKVRNRVLLLLSSKHAGEISTIEGKRQLADEIVASLKEPFADKGSPQQVSDVLFTAFIIQ
jgi:flagellar protein FliL